jgi:periplasmic protein TonB
VFAQLPTRLFRLRPVLLSAGAHVVVALLLFVSLRTRPVRVFGLPGTSLGDRMQLTWLPGRAPVSAPPVKNPVKNKVRSHTQPPKPVPPTHSLAAATPPPPAMPPASATVPDAATGSDSWGNGAIEIAFTTYSPSPAPDLSSLPRGVQGDVVVDVTIDAAGKVSNLALLHTIGYGIENSVLSTLKSWTFRPAMKDGTPIASVQELHFHYGPV